MGGCTDIARTPARTQEGINSVKFSSLNFVKEFRRWLASKSAKIGQNSAKIGKKREAFVSQLRHTEFSHNTHTQEGD